MRLVDLNCDLGESFGCYQLGMDEEIIPFVSSANVACAFHASDPVVMSETAKLVKKAGVSIGAHPGYPDLVGFGRRNMAIPPREVKAIVQYQIGALEAFCRANGLVMAHVKPHGALYNMAAKDEALAAAICEGIYEVNPELILLGLSGSCLIRAAKDTGLAAASEEFADRAYEEDGSLVARTKPQAMITDEEQAMDRVVDMILKGTVVSITGREIPLRADSICVHGDGPQALTFVRKIRQRLQMEGIGISSLRKVLNSSFL